MIPVIPNTVLGKSVPAPKTYDPRVLCPIPRKPLRQTLPHLPPFHGSDLWTIYELSWLTPSGTPAIACASLFIDAHSTHLIESKSLKLYFTGLNQTVFHSEEFVCQTIQRDLESASQGKVTVILHDPALLQTATITGISLDTLPITTHVYTRTPNLLLCDRARSIQEKVYTHLFRSLCPVTGQPDWASVFIHYQGFPLSHESLLRYLISYRMQAAFHEQCVEQIFMDLFEVLGPTQLTVFARFTRRGGIDINPFRSNFESPPNNHPLLRQ